MIIPMMRRIRKLALRNLRQIGLATADEVTAIQFFHIFVDLRIILVQYEC